MCNLPNYNAVMRTNIEGERIVPTIFRTIRPSMPSNVASPELLKQNSRQKYGIPKSLAEEIVKYSLDSTRSMTIDLSEMRMNAIKQQGWEQVDLGIVTEYWRHDSELYDDSMEAIAETIESIFLYLTKQGGLPKEKIALLWEKIKGLTYPDFYINPDRFEDYVKVPGTEQVCTVINFLKDLGKAKIKLHWLEQSARRGHQELREVNKSVRILREKSKSIEAYKLLRNLEIIEYSDEWLNMDDFGVFGKD